MAVRTVIAMRTRQGKTLVIALASAAGLAVAGTIAYKVLSERKGESALQYVPADSFMVMSFDTAPSARQALTMKNISSALQREGLDKRFDEAVAGMLQEHPLGNELRKNLGTSYAMAGWTDEKKQPHMAGFFAVTDRGRVEELVKQGVAEKTPVILNMMGDYLVATDSQNTFQKILDVKEGKAANIMSSPAYTKCRTGLPADANLLMYIDYSRAMNMAGAVNPDQAKYMDQTVGFSLTIEPEGLAMDSVTLPNSADNKLIPEMPALKQLELSRIPAGDFGTIAFEGYGAIAKQYLDVYKDMIPDFNKHMKEFETKSGLTVEGDLLPLISGTAIIGVYPGPTSAPEDIDFIVRAQGDAGAAARVSAAIRKAATESGKEKVTFTEVDIAGNKVWQSSPFNSKGTTAMDSKSAFIGEFEDGLNFSTSRSLLEAFMTGSKPTTDGTILKASGDNVNSLVTIHHGRLLTRFQPQLTEQLSSSKSPISFADILESFGGAEGTITITARRDGDRILGRAMIPMNYDKLISVIGATMKQVGEPAPAVFDAEIK